MPSPVASALLVTTAPGPVAAPVNTRGQTVDLAATAGDGTVLPTDDTDADFCAMVELLPGGPVLSAVQGQVCPDLAPAAGPPPVAVASGAKAEAEDAVMSDAQFAAFIEGTAASVAGPAAGDGPTDTAPVPGRPATLAALVLMVRDANGAGGAQTPDGPDRRDETLGGPGTAALSAGTNQTTAASGSSETGGETGPGSVTRTPSLPHANDLGRPPPHANATPAQLEGAMSASQSGSAQIAPDRVMPTPAVSKPAVPKSILSAQLSSPGSPIAAPAHGPAMTDFSAQVLPPTEGTAIASLLPTATGFPEDSALTALASQATSVQAGSRPSGPEPHLARHVAQQMAVAVTTTHEHTTEIRLDPQELGHVRLSLQTADSAIQVVVHAERPETADLMRRHIDQLAQEFRSLGYQDVSFSFGSGHDRSDPRPLLTGGPDRATGPGPQRAPEGDSPAAPPPRNAAASGHLDLRL